MNGEPIRVFYTETGDYLLVTALRHEGRLAVKLSSGEPDRYRYDWDDDGRWSGPLAVAPEPPWPESEDVDPDGPDPDEIVPCAADGEVAHVASCRCCKCRPDDYTPEATAAADRSDEAAAYGGLDPYNYGG